MTMAFSLGNPSFFFSIVYLFVRTNVGIYLDFSGDFLKRFLLSER